MQIDKQQCLVIIPAKDEQNTISTVLKNITKEGFQALVIDDASSDNTKQIARDSGAIVIPLAINIGAWNATQTGIRYALANGYKYCITMDADGQHSAATLAQLLHSAPDYDVVIASYLQRGNFSRQLAWSFFKKLAGFNINDLTSGFRIYNKPAMLVVASRQATLLEYQDVGVLMLLTQHQLSITEIETEMTTRADGKSRIFSSWLKIFYYLLYTSLLSIAKTTPIKRIKSYHQKNKQP